MAEKRLADRAIATIHRAPPPSGACVSGQISWLSAAVGGARSAVRGRSAFILAALVLLSASIAKTAELFWNCPARFLLYREDALVHVLHIQWEALLAVWLLLTRRPTLFPWLTAATWFSLLTAISVRNLLGSIASCDCFGMLRLPPSVVLAVDLSVLGVLTATAKPALVVRQRIAATLKSLGWPALVSLIVGTVSAYGLEYAQTKTTATIKFRHRDAHTTVLLKIEDWIGLSCPLLGVLDSPVDLSHGRWTLLLVRMDCEACRNAIRALEANPGKAGGDRVCIVELPGTPHGLSLPIGDLPVARIHDARPWYAGSPALLVLQDGLVLDAKTSIVF